MKDTNEKDALAYVSLWCAEFPEHLGYARLGMDVKRGLWHQNQENPGSGAQRCSKGRGAL